MPGFGDDLLVRVLDLYILGLCFLLYGGGPHSSALIYSFLLGERSALFLVFVTSPHSAMLC